MIKMNNKKNNKENLLNIIQIWKKIKSDGQYIEDARIKQFIHWIKLDINEIVLIQKQMKKQMILNYAYKVKEPTNIPSTEPIVMDIDNIVNIYKIVNEELNSWRNLSLKFQICGL